MTILSIINSDCMKAMRQMGKFDCIFADPPDNIGLKYGIYGDEMPDSKYLTWLERLINRFPLHADIIWLSFNAKWTFAVGEIFNKFLKHNKDWSGKPCVQTFTFGQYTEEDLANNHRPLWRLMKNGAKLYPKNILEPSWRQLNGDKRAADGGRVPGDVFNFPRVTGNSKQRRAWHPTQLHEGLVERCILFSTEPDGQVLDPFAGTGTTLRVCQKHNRQCFSIEQNSEYCLNIAKELQIEMIVTA